MAGENCSDQFFNDLYPSTITVPVIKSKMMKWENIFQTGVKEAAFEKYERGSVNRIMNFQVL